MYLRFVNLIRVLNPSEKMKLIFIDFYRWKKYAGRMHNDDEKNFNLSRIIS